MRRFLRRSLTRLLASKVSVLVGLMLVGALVPAGASAAGPLSLGFDTWAGAEQSSDLGLAASDGASIVRVNVNWAWIAPALPPPGFVGSSPVSPGYNWSGLDQAIGTVTASGLTPAITIYNAPVWAEGPNPPSAAPPGSWEPNAQDLAQFATAVAERYSGRFPDPNQPGAYLPRVSVWQAWNEPNLDYYLSPQWTLGPNGKYQAVAPSIYRSLLNAFYTAVKSVSASNRVMMAGTAPYGDTAGTDPLGRERTAPLAFDRDVFCLTVKLRPYSCPSVHLDGVDHHPYSATSQGPMWHATHADDVAVPDMYKIVLALDAGVKYGHVLPKQPKSVWASEVGWTSDLPNPEGVPMIQDAHWYEQAFYVLWKQGVDTAMVTEIRDQPVAPYVFQDGLYLIDGQPKTTMVTAYRFPFVTQRLKGSAVQAWGRAPQAGRVAIQMIRRGHWTTLTTIPVQSHQVFTSRLMLRGRATLRAVIGSQVSLRWFQNAPG